MSYEYEGNLTPSSIDMDEQVKKYAVEDIKEVSKMTLKEAIDVRHLETLKEQTKAYSREEQLAVACSIKADVLLEALGMEFARLNVFEERVRAIIL